MRSATVRLSALASIAAVALSLVLLACAPEQLLDAPPATTPLGGGHPELLPHSVALSIDVEKGEVHLVAPPGSDTTAVIPGLANSLIGNTELTVSTSNVVRGAPANGRVALTFDVAITNLLNSGQLVTPTFPAPPAGQTGLLLIPFQIRDKVGPGTVLRGPDWDGAPYNFFNDANCLLSFLSSSDCYPYEPFPGPLAAGATTAPRKVGFNVDRRVTSFTVLMVLAADIQNTPLPPAPTGAIAGRVTSPQAGALAGISVRTGGKQATSDVAGGFQITGVAVGSAAITLGPLPAGCTDPGATNATVLPGGIANAEIVVTCPTPPVTTGTISGTVTSASRGPLYGVAVVANPGNHAGASGLDGSYTIPGVPAGSVMLTVANLPSGCTKPADRTVTLVAGSTVTAALDVSCDGGSSTTGNLIGTLNGRGGPLAGVSIRLQPANLTTTSDAQGAYVFASVPAGQVQLSFANLPAGCTNPGTTTVEIAGGRTVTLPVDVACLPIGSLAGVVHDQDGAPVVGGDVWLRLGTEQWEAVTGADGSYSFADLVLGDYEVLAGKRGCTPRQVFLSLATSGITYQPFTLDCPPHLTGKVTSTGTAPLPASLRVRLTPDGGGTTFERGLQPDGSYDIAVPEGGYFVQLTGEPGYCLPPNGAQSLDLRQQVVLTKDWSIYCQTPIYPYVTPSVRDFGDVGVDVSRPHEFTVTNPSSAMTVSFGWSGDVQDFQERFTTDCTAAPLPSLGTCHFTVWFTPTALGPRSAEITVNFNRPGLTVLDPVDLSGTGTTASDLTATPASLDYGAVPLGNSATLPVVIANAGPYATGPLLLVDRTGDANDFQQVRGGCTVGTASPGFAPGQNCTVNLSFSPGTAGSRSATLTYAARPGGRVTVQASGSGGPAIGQAIITPDRSAIDFAQTYASTPLEPANVNSGVYLTNTGTIATGVLATVIEGRDADAFTITSNGCAGRALIPLETCLIAMRLQSPIEGQKEALLTISGAPASTLSLDLLGEVLPSTARSIVEGQLSATNRPMSTFVGVTVQVNGVPVTTDANAMYRAVVDAGAVTIAPQVIDPRGCSSPPPATLTVAHGVRVIHDFSIPCIDFGSIIGTARDKEGKPVISGSISLVAEDGSEIDGATDIDGTYRIDGIPPGTATMRFGGSTCLDAPPQQVQVIANSTVTSNFSVSCPGVINGFVTNSRTGQGLAGVRVNVLDNATLVAWLPETGSGGGYVFQVNDGTFQVFLDSRDVPAGCTAPPPQTVTLHEQDRVGVNIAVTCP